MKNTNTKNTAGDILTQVLKPIVRLWMYIVFQAEVERNELIDYNGPVFLIGPHISFEDAIVAMLYTNRLIRYLAADTNFDTLWKKILFTLFNIIPFARGQMDLRAIRKLKENVNNGKSVGLYPEGERTWDGGCLEPKSATAKLVKLLNVPLYNIELIGFYFIKPRWAKNHRKGKCKINIVKLLSVKQIKKLSWQEISQVIIDALDRDEFQWQRDNKIKYIGKSKAEHIEKVIYKCPECNKINTFTSNKDEFYCKSCNIKYYIDDYGFIQNCKQFDNIRDWNTWQKQYIDEIINNKFSFTNKDMKVDIVKDNVVEKIVCDVIINNEILTINNLDIEFNLIESISAIFTDVIEFYVQGRKYRLKFDPKKHMSIILFSDLIKNLITSFHL